MGNKKYIVIILVLLIVIGLGGAYIVFGPNGYAASQKSQDFLEDVMELQSTLSYYVGSSYSDAFGVYSKVELLSGETEDGEKVKDNEDNLLPELIDKDSAIDYEDDKAYELNMDNVKTTLKLSMDSYDGVTFYVVEGDVVKIKLESTPEWWDENYDVLLLN